MNMRGAGGGKFEAEYNLRAGHNPNPGYIAPRINPQLSFSTGQVEHIFSMVKGE